MTRDDIVKALRCCTSTPNYERCAAECSFCRGSDVSKCIPNMRQMAADLLENDAKALDALTLENARLRSRPEDRCVSCEYLKVRNTDELYAECTKLGTKFLPFGLDTREHYCSCYSDPNGGN